MLKIRRGFNKSPLGLKLALLFLLLWIASALFAPFIANEGSNYIIPYSANGIDLNNASVGPFGDQNITSSHERHWLGTDHIGRDVLSNLLHGSRTALLIGFGAMLIAAFIGILLGGISAYYEDNGIKISRFELIAYGLLKLIALLGLLIFPWQYLSAFECIILVLVFSVFILIAVFIVKRLSLYLKKKKALKQINYPVDLIIGRIIEILDAIPLLLILIVLAAVIKPSIFSTTLIIGLTAWAGVARFSRAELLKVKRENYIESASALGLNKFRVVFMHMLPNAMPAILISLAFGVSASILIESTLSFLGLGISTDTASWGKLLAESRADYAAWWLAVFPGLAIFATVLSCNIIGQELSQTKKR